MSVASTLGFDNIEIVIVKSSLTLLKRMPRSESEPVSITVKRPSLGDFKRMYKAATADPNHWLTILWGDENGRPTFDAENPYREIRGPKRQGIFQALSPKPGDEEEFLSATINIQGVRKAGVTAKKNTIPVAFQKVIEELNLNNL